MDGQRGSLIYSNGILQEYVAKAMYFTKIFLQIDEKGCEW